MPALLGRFTATASATGSLQSPLTVVVLLVRGAAQLDVVRGIIYISMCQLITVSSVSPHLHPFDALPLGGLIVPVLKSAWAAHTAVVIGQDSSLESIIIQPSSTSGTELRNPVFLRRQPTRNPPCASPAQRVPQTINDESRFPASCGSFLPHVSSDLRSFDDVTDS